MNRLLTIFLFLLTISWAEGQDVSFSAQAPQAVRAAERFYLTYEVNKEGHDFKGGDMSGFSVLGGPSRSTSSSISIINGRMQQSVSIRYTYILEAKKEGKYTISPASITIDGKRHASNPVIIEVVKSDPSVASGDNQKEATRGISDKDLFVRISVNKKTAYKGEELIATVKLYTRVQLQQLSDVKIPQFDGFWRENIERKDNVVNWQQESVDGQLYNVGVISEFVLIPQKSGTVTIDPINLEVVAIQEVRQKQRGRNFFNDPFFDNFFDQTSYERVNKTLQSPAVKINVKDVPVETDMVGSFKLHSEISKTEVDANESISLKLRLTGKGNLKTSNPFDIEFPSDFEVFDPEITQNIKVTTNGLSGSKTIEYLLIPRHAGTYTIPSVELNCFNPSSGKLEKLHSQTYQVSVRKGEGQMGGTGTDYAGNRSDIRVIGKDIRYIKTNDYILRNEKALWFQSASFYFTYISGIIGFMALIIFTRKKRKESDDRNGNKKRKAGIVARKRLKSAEKALSENQRSLYYQELLKALWSYLEDKLNLKTADLSKDKIRKVLVEHQASEQSVNNLISLMEKCEMAQYAPLGSNASLSEEHETGIEIISKLEEEIKS